MPIDLILCDWEGCVSDPGGGTVPWPTHKIAELSDVLKIMRADSRYPPFALCTGRQFPYGEAALQALNAMWDNIPSILENGSGLYYPKTKKVILNRNITSNVIKAMTDIRIKLMQIIGEIGGEMERGKEYCISLNPPVDQGIESLYNQISDVLNPFLDIVEIRRSISAVDITPKGVNKGTGVQFLSEITEIPLQNIVGIGDSSNDLPMLSLVGHPACPSNSELEVMKVAEYISSFRITDGVIDIIRHYCGIGN